MLFPQPALTIRDFPDHANFREKGATLACADKHGGFLSLTLCNKADFDPFNKSNMVALKICERGKKCRDIYIT